MSEKKGSEFEDDEEDCQMSGTKDTSPSLSESSENASFGLHQLTLSMPSNIAVTSTTTTIPPTIQLFPSSTSSLDGIRNNTADHQFLGSSSNQVEESRIPQEKSTDIKRWTNEEHRLFLIGLKKYGKGKWKMISNKIIKSKSASQVASHAQKYFIRQDSTDKSKRKSIHDINIISSEEASASHINVISLNPPMQHEMSKNHPHQMKLQNDVSCSNSTMQQSSPRGRGHLVTTQQINGQRQDEVASLYHATRCLHGNHSWSIYCSLCGLPYYSTRPL